MAGRKPPVPIQGTPASPSAVKSGATFNRQNLPGRKPPVVKPASGIAKPPMKATPASRFAPPKNVRGKR